MNTPRKTAVIVGVLFIIATAFLFIGEAFYKPILSSPDYLEITYPNRTVVIIGILLEFICVLAMPVLATVLIRRGNEVFRREIHQSEESFGLKS